MTTVTLPLKDIMSCMDFDLYASSLEASNFAAGGLLSDEPARACCTACIVPALEGSTAAITCGLLLTRYEKAGD